MRPSCAFFHSFIAVLAMPCTRSLPQSQLCNTAFICLVVRWCITDLSSCQYH